MTQKKITEEELDEIAAFSQIFSYLMRSLNEIAIHMPKKQSKEVLYIISSLEKLIYSKSAKEMKKNYDLTGNL